jgi:serine/threonine protein kinase
LEDEPKPTPISYARLQSQANLGMIHSSQIKYGDHVLGSGAQGVVYRAEWNHRPVVLKLLHIRQGAAEKNEFMRELDVWRCVLKSRVLDITDLNHRNIQHPNAIALYGAVDDSGKIGYVMEYCRNGSLYLILQVILIISILILKDTIT